MASASFSEVYGIQNMDMSNISRFLLTQEQLNKDGVQTQIFSMVGRGQDVVCQAVVTVHSDVEGAWGEVNRADWIQTDNFTGNLMFTSFSQEEKELLVKQAIRFF